MGLAFHEVGRQAIINDPDWKVGSYSSQPQKGLSLARQVGHITYLSHDLLNRKFGRNRTKNGKAKFSPRYAMQDYLRYKGRHFVGRFDANSYLYITWAIDNFDLTKNSSARLNKVFKETKAKFLVISFTSDWLYPPADSQDLVAGLAEAGVPVVYKNLDLPYGHDSFLVYNNTLGNVLQDFIEAEWREYIAEHELRCA
jgi:homoserine O-acetyltransferase